MSKSRIFNVANMSLDIRENKILAKVSEFIRVKKNVCDGGAKSWSHIRCSRKSLEAFWKHWHLEK